MRPLIDMQLETTRQQLADAQVQKAALAHGTAEDAAYCSSGSASHAASLTTAPPAPSHVVSQPSALEQAPGTPHAPSASLASLSSAPGSMVAAASACLLGQPGAADLAADMSGGGPHTTASPRLGEQLSALSPFAKARGFMAQREADAAARLKV